MVSFIKTNGKQSWIMLDQIPIMPCSEIYWQADRKMHEFHSSPISLLQIREKLYPKPMVLVSSLSDQIIQKTSDKKQACSLRYLITVIVGIPYMVVVLEIEMFWVCLQKFLAVEILSIAKQWLVK